MPDDTLLTDLFGDDIKQNRKHIAKEVAKPKPKICIKHSRIEINDYEVGQSAQLEYLFSIYDAMTRQRVPRGAEYDPIGHRLILPRGMNIEMLKRIFNTVPYVDRECDPYVGTQPLQIKYLARDERQLRILKFLIGAEEYAYTQSKSQLAVNTTTGSGKTFVTVAAMCMKGARMVIITSSVGWLAQWAEKICEYTRLTPKDLYTLTGRASIERLFTRNPMEYQVFMASHATLHSYADNHELGWMAIDELFRYMRCEIKVFDECHLYFNNMTKLDFHSNVKKTIYLTATPARSQKEEDIIFQEYFKNVPAIELFDPVTDPHVNYVGMLYYSEPSPTDVKRFSVGQFQFDRNIYMGYLTPRPNFLKLTTILIDMTLRIPGKVLIYVGINESIEYVRQYIINEFPFLERAIGIYTSIVTDKQLRREMLMKKFILSTTKSCGAASDIADLSACIVLNEPFRSKVTARQTLGRCRNDNTLYIDCVDMSCYRTKLYYQSKKPVYNQYAKSCSEVLMTNDILNKKYEEVHQYWQTKKLLTIPAFTR